MARGAADGYPTGRTSLPRRVDDSRGGVSYRAGVSTPALVRTVVDRARRPSGWLRPPLAADLALVLGFGIFAVLVTVQAARAGSGQRRLDWLAWGLLAVATVALVARRRRPAMVVLVTSAATVASVGLGYPLGLIWVAPLLALYTAAAGGHRRLAVVAGGMQAAVLVGWALADPELGTPAQVAMAVLNVALAVATGEVSRGRRDYLAEAERRAIEAERTREETARRRAGEERLRLARDLHDITAHTIAVIAIQAGVAEEALAEGPEPAREAVRAIRASSRQALAELKATVVTLREGEEAAPPGPLPGLDRLGELVAMAQRGGVRVELAVSGATRPLPPAVELTAYRIAQEALTNVLRHAQATSATVGLRYARDALQVEVDDDGHRDNGVESASGRPSEDPDRQIRRSGHGLAVMAERAAAIGGHLEAGAKPAGGWRVHAWLPLGEDGP
jgi:signal transduction histidine kinase